MNRERLTRWAEFLIAAAIAVIGARYGIPIPPPPVPLPGNPPDVRPVDPPAPPSPQPNTPAAIARIQFGNSGCTATIIGPRRSDGRWWALTAAHCVSGPGQRGTMRLLDGRTEGVQVVSRDPRSDCAWLVTDSNHEKFPFALLAESSPPVGSKVWHAGYGVHVPGNREDGTVTGAPDSNGQLRFRISVSSGDSGGGICLDDSGRVVSCVCCTTQRGAIADVWGASVESIRRSQPTAMVMDDWTPIEVPMRPGTGPGP